MRRLRPLLGRQDAARFVSLQPTRAGEERTEYLGSPLLQALSADSPSLEAVRALLDAGADPTQKGGPACMRPLETLLARRPAASVPVAALCAALLEAGAAASSFCLTQARVGPRT